MATNYCKIEKQSALPPHSMKQGGRKMLLDVILCAGIALLLLVLLWKLLRRLFLKK